MTNLDMHDLGKHKCPECGVFVEFQAMGPYRVQCPHCDSVIKNEELEKE